MTGRNLYFYLNSKAMKRFDIQLSNKFIVEAFTKEVVQGPLNRKANQQPTLTTNQQGTILQESEATESVNQDSVA
ncbi:hypothetical protein G6F43_004983 [Rhizopus delemar]|nr:hypothetical protein G6F43_004983 [Rhizopus delemar]